MRDPQATYTMIYNLMVLHVYHYMPINKIVILKVDITVKVHSLHLTLCVNDKSGYN